MLLDLFLGLEFLGFSGEVKFGNNYSLVKLHNNTLLSLKDLSFHIPARCELELYIHYENGDAETQRNFIKHDTARNIEMPLLIVSLLSPITQILFRFYSEEVKTTSFECKVSFQIDGRIHQRIKRLKKHL